MTGSTGGIWAICGVAVLTLAFWLSMVFYASRHPGHKHRRKEPLPGLVVGGQHVGGGRSAGPHRDAPAAGGRAPSAAEPDVEDSDRELAAPGRRRGGSPMDLRGRAGDGMPLRAGPGRAAGSAPGSTAA
ncbi:MAG TPA: hypothetical protein VKV35_04480 [Streptosporangiaceae bacterium]|jgi:hypothetical protein|nr:hypothetical protein [Streptosporangiaceae bacterium]